MFYYISGTLVTVTTEYAAIDCSGVCYKLMISGTTYSKIATKLNSKALLYTYLNVREDIMELYGFSTEEELDCFKRLISVSGVGPKAALAILTALSVEAFISAINSGDARAISAAQGVGLKTAQKVILELKGKLLTTETAEPVANKNEDSSDAVNALIVLGYSRQQAVDAIKHCTSAKTVEEKIRDGLKYLSKV